MHHKNIKRIVKKQLEKDHPNWKNIQKKEKKRLAQEVTEAVIRDYDFSAVLDIPIEELLGISNQSQFDGILGLEEIGKMVTEREDHKLANLKKLRKLRGNIKEPLLKYVDELLDDHIINRLLAYKGYTPSKRDFFPSHFFNAELLKTLMYPEISYRKYCSEEYFGLDRKQNRTFIGLPLHKKQMIDHTQLSQFRSSLSFSQNINLLSYILFLVKRSGMLNNCAIHGVDSTELANDNIRPLFSTEIRGKKIRIYKDLDCDSGKRRNKRDKSPWVIGYRMHTLTAIDVKTKQSFPLISLISPANHHDSLFLKSLIQLAQAVGIEMKLITADEAYHDEDGSIQKETGVELITPPSQKTKLPDNVEVENLAVTFDDLCEIPMRRIGNEGRCHEFKCNAQPGQCMHSDNCPQFRLIPIDKGVFQSIPIDSEFAESAMDIRKNCERPFNLLKHREGLEQIRVRSQKSLITKCTIATMATLLIEMESRYHDRDKDDPQMTLFDFVA
ncbi:MAG: transposase [SAR324 cluster bacterium]|nr:transposase [SAR324 cluster bacterium]